MFRHSIETFEHGLEHYLDGSEKSRKFALLHIDQSIELVLKEKIIQLGKSIYKTDGTTLNLHEVFKSLNKNLSIIEQPRLEELHDLRNTVQHKGLTPDPTSTKFYIEIAYSFFKRFLHEELSISIDDILPSNYRALMQDSFKPSKPIEEKTEILSVLQEAQNAGDLSAQVIKGYTVLNLVVKSIGEPVGSKVPFRLTLRQAAEKNGFSRAELEPYLTKIFTLRNAVLHSQCEPTKEEVEDYLNAVSKVLYMLGYTEKDEI